MKINDLMQQLADEIDSRLNASFGQTHSTNQHVYRIYLCKALPYYGYHSGEHQFFRIELYNPNLMKRTAHFLQSGSILGKIFQPHESHIPYVLKFFIDYNLFGMSYLHVPLQKVHTRYADDSKFKKRAVSHLEVDFKACFIINRVTLSNLDDKKAANAGIESIWEDERKRRLNIFENDAPELKVPDDEIRDCMPTSSDEFFKNALKVGLEAAKSLNESSMSDTNTEPSSYRELNYKKKFNLTNFLDTSAYAVECSQSSESSHEEKSLNASQSVKDLESFFINAQNSDKVVEAYVDSLLAPFSQETDDKNDLKNNDDEEEEESEFNLTVADLENMFLNVSDDLNETIIPQLDGVDDDEKLSPSQLTFQRDCERNYHPVAGTSKTTSTEDILNSSSVQRSLRNLANVYSKNEEIASIKVESGSDEDEHMMSFYDQSFNDFESDNESDGDTNIIKDEKCIITLSEDPPDPSSVLEKLVEYDIPSTITPIAFYSNPADITEKKEVGGNILEVPGNKLNDCEEYKSLLFDSNQMTFYQNLQLQRDLGFIPKSSMRHELLNDETKIEIQPIEIPPTYEDAKKWLKSFEKKDKKDELEESPVKMKRERTLMVLDLEENPEDLDKTLIPATPQPSSSLNNSEVIESSLEKDSMSLTQFVEDDLSFSARRAKRSRKMKQNFSKRFQEIMKAKISSDNVSIDSPQSSLVSDSSEELIKESQDSSERTFDSSFIVNANTPEGFLSNESHEIFSSTFGFKLQLESLQSSDEHNDLTILSMELHVQTRGDFKPNPEHDEISAIFYSLEGFYDKNYVLTSRKGIIAVSKISLGYFKEGINIQRVGSEQEMLEIFFQKIQIYDPDIFAGYELELGSWGYLIERGCALNLNFCNALSRTPLEKDEVKKAQTVFIDEEDTSDSDYFTEQRIRGRILLDVWRLMRHEIALTSYTFENISYHILHRRYPKHSHKTLTEMWKNPLMRWIVLDYYAMRAHTLLEILKQLDLIGRTCELAKLFGIQFFEVLSRGSQFRVESMMLRIAKRRNYIPVSPSVQQRVHMRSPEYIALILEPESRFYTDPVIVLDFQSLYPSIIIAYNYCFSTCLGRVEHLSKGSQLPFEFGAYQLRISPTRLQYLLDKDLITVSPCGVAYVKKSVKEGVLPRMLKEILDTRQMVKQSMKLYKNNNALQRVLHSRQLGLKLIANVTYGYTAANFSGRMPAIEVGDSVVSKGRETLERAISLVERNEKWRVKVCYGDTDSMFVLVPGRTRAEAFKIGEEISEAVTKDNPFPIKLKLEKVYQPCILQTKKRYVGNMYESADQEEPVFEAKGIETIRRDGCPSSAKVLEKSLKILFNTHDVSKVKKYVCRQFTKILEGKASMQDLIIAKEFRGISGYKEKASVPALTLTR